MRHHLFTATKCFGSLVLVASVAIDASAASPYYIACPDEVTLAGPCTGDDPNPTNAQFDDCLAQFCPIAAYGGGATYQGLVLSSQSGDVITVVNHDTVGIALGVTIFDSSDNPIYPTRTIAIAPTSVRKIPLSKLDIGAEAVRYELTVSHYSFDPAALQASSLEPTVYVTAPVAAGGVVTSASSALHPDDTRGLYVCADYPSESVGRGPAVDCAYWGAQCPACAHFTCDGQSWDCDYTPCYNANTKVAPAGVSCSFWEKQCPANCTFTCDGETWLCDCAGPATLLYSALPTADITCP